MAFQKTDNGNYACIVRASDNNATESKSVEIMFSPPTTPARNLVECRVSSVEIYFQIRVLNTACLSWSESLKERITANFLTKIINVIDTECAQCYVKLDKVKIAEPPVCSDLVDRAAFFEGSISTPQRETTEELFCALSNWQESEPIIQIDGELHSTDLNCPLQSNPPGNSSNSECLAFISAQGFTVTTIVIGVIVVIIFFSGLLLCFFSSFISSKGCDK